MPELYLNENTRTQDLHRFALAHRDADGKDSSLRGRVEMVGGKEQIVLFVRQKSGNWLDGLLDRIGDWLAADAQRKCAVMGILEIARREDVRFENLDRPLDTAQRLKLSELEQLLEPPQRVLDAVQRQGTGLVVNDMVQLAAQLSQYADQAVARRAQEAQQADQGRLVWRGMASLPPGLPELSASYWRATQGNARDALEFCQLVDFLRRPVKNVAATAFDHAAIRKFLEGYGSTLRRQPSLMGKVPPEWQAAIETIESEMGEDFVCPPLGLFLRELEQRLGVPARSQLAGLSARHDDFIRYFDIADSTPAEILNMESACSTAFYAFLDRLANPAAARQPDQAGVQDEQVYQYALAWKGTMEQGSRMKNAHAPNPDQELISQVVDLVLIHRQQQAVQGLRKHLQA